MKIIWTILFLAIGAAVFGIAALLVPADQRNDKFWLSMGGIAVSLVLVYVAFAFAPGPRGEQGGSMMRAQMAAGGLLYLLATLGLAGVSVTGISFTWLAVMHILALLAWVFIVASGALGAAGLKKADDETKPN